jgi:ectoine hydroxylase-related dioxygenase (phytanoyl-CoA dioxygenase family)
VSEHTIHFRLKNPPRPNLEWKVDAQCSPEEVAQFASEGFLLRQDLFSSAQIAEMTRAVDELAERERAQGVAEITRWGQYVALLLDKHPVFRDLIYHKTLISIARAMLGPQIQFDVVDARITDNPAEVVEWHVHSQCIYEPLPPFFCYPHAIHCLLFLDPIDASNGPLCVLPGSHQRYREDVPTGPAKHSDIPGQRIMNLSAGTCVLTHSHLWHRTIPAKGVGFRRRMLIIGFLPACVKPFANHYEKLDLSVAASKDLFRQRPTEVLRRGPDAEIRELLGEFNWP